MRKNPPAMNSYSIYDKIFEVLPPNRRYILQQTIQQTKSQKKPSFIKPLQSSQNRIPSSRQQKISFLYRKNTPENKDRTCLQEQTQKSHFRSKSQSTSTHHFSQDQETPKSINITAVNIEVSHNDFQSNSQQIDHDTPRKSLSSHSHKSFSNEHLNEENQGRHDSNSPSFNYQRTVKEQNFEGIILPEGKRIEESKIKPIEINDFNKNGDDLIPEENSMSPNMNLYSSEVHRSFRNSEISAEGMSPETDQSLSKPLRSPIKKTINLNEISAQERENIDQNIQKNFSESTKISKNSNFPQTSPNNYDSPESIKSPSPWNYNLEELGYSQIKKLLHCERLENAKYRQSLGKIQRTIESLDAQKEQINEEMKEVSKSRDKDYAYINAQEKELDSSKAMCENISQKIEKQGQEINHLKKEIETTHLLCKTYEKTLLALVNNPNFSSIISQALDNDLVPQKISSIEKP